MVDAETISVIFGGVGLGIAAIYYVLNLKTQLETRKVQLFEQLARQFGTNEFQREAAQLLTMQWTDFDDFTRKFDSSVNPENWAIRSVHWGLLENVGYSLKKGLIDPDMAFYMLGGFYAVWMWEKFGGVIKQYRTAINLPHWYTHFEYLAEEVNRRHPLKVRPEYGNISQTR